MFWEGLIGLESPTTTKRVAEDVEEEMSGEGVYISPTGLPVNRRF